jgi:hypothetical protein
MAAIAIISVLVGASLGLRFKVFVLFPAIPSVLAIIAVGGTLRDQTIWWIVVAMVVGAISVQLGYFCGSFLWFGVHKKRHPKINSAAAARDMISRGP